MSEASPEPLDRETLTRLYRDLVRIRLVEERIVELYPEWEMRCPVHLSIGQEAVAVGVCAHLGRRDWVMSGHRSHGHYLAKGGDLRAMFAELYGKATGCTSGKGGSMHLLDLEAGFLGAVPIVASTIAMAVGAAWGSRLRGEERVVAAFFGEAATEEGAFHEALNFAALKRLPVLFVCENNFFSVYSPMAVRQPPNRQVSDLARGHGIASWQGDGNDTKNVYALAGSAAARARRGEGPAFLEFQTYRWREHCGPFYDNDIGYRTEADFLAWKARCPVARLEQEVEAQGVMTAPEIGRVRATIASEIDEAVAFARASPFPPAHDMAAFTYAE
ncbi:MAG: thiamine pyrophosphate-dependent dehydrogenase E1 component subunit alpha [Acidobacteriota bacterium]